MSDSRPPQKPKRILHATKVGPVDMLAAMRRCANGETPSAVAREIGISHQTLIRWWTEYSRDLDRLDDMLREANTGEAYQATQEMARHVAEAEKALDRVQAALDVERQKLQSARRKWLANNILAKAARTIAALVQSR